MSPVLIKLLLYRRYGTDLGYGDLALECCLYCEEWVNICNVGDTFIVCTVGFIDWSHWKTERRVVLRCLSFGIRNDKLNICACYRRFCENSCLFECLGVKLFCDYV